MTRREGKARVTEINSEIRQRGYSRATATRISCLSAADGEMTVPGLITPSDLRIPTSRAPMSCRHYELSRSHRHIAVDTKSIRDADRCARSPRPPNIRPEASLRLCLANDYSHAASLRTERRNHEAIDDLCEPVDRHRNGLAEPPGKYLYDRAGGMDHAQIDRQPVYGIAAIFGDLT